MAQACHAPADRFAVLRGPVLDLLPKLDGSAVKVYVALAARVNAEGVCWPSAKCLMTDTGLTKRSVWRAIDALVEAALLTRSKSTRDDGRPSANRYSLTPKAIGDTNAPHHPSDRCHKRTGDSDTHVTTIVTQTHQGTNTNRTNTIELPSPCPKLRFDEADRETAEWMLGLILAMNPKHRRPNLDQWANAIRLMREKDGRTEAEIRAVFGWANQDDFWRSNILSPDKLRGKFDQLTLKQRTNANGTSNRYKPGPGQRHPADVRDQVGTF